VDAMVLLSDKYILKIPKCPPATVRGCPLPPSNSAVEDFSNPVDNFTEASFWQTSKRMNPLLRDEPFQWKICKRGAKNLLQLAMKYQIQSGRISRGESYWITHETIARGLTPIESKWTTFGNTFEYEL
jgi:hypothetical protein